MCSGKLCDEVFSIADERRYLHVGIRERTVIVRDLHPERISIPVLNKTHLRRINLWVRMEQISQAIGKKRVPIDGSGHDTDDCGAGVEAGRMGKMRGILGMRSWIEWQGAIPDSSMVSAGIAQVVQAVEPGLQYRR